MIKDKSSLWWPILGAFLLFSCAFLNVSIVRADENENNFTVVLQQYKTTETGETLATSEEAQPLEKDDHIFINDSTKVKSLQNNKWVLTGNLPTEDAIIQSVTSSIDSIFSEPTISYKTDTEGKKTYIIEYRLTTTASEAKKAYAKLNLLGGWCFSVQVNNNGKTEDFFAVFENTNRTSTEHVNISSINMMDTQKEELLVGDSEITSLGKGDERYRYVRLESEVGTIAFQVNREQRSLLPIGQDSTYAAVWLTIGCNYISANGGEVQRFDVCSRQGDKNYTPTVALKKGYNLVNLYFMGGRNSLIDAYSETGDTINIPFPFYQKTGTTYRTSTTYLFSIPYIIYYEGESNESKSSNDANIRSLDPLSYATKYGETVAQYAYQLNNTNNAIKVYMPKDATYNKIFLGILPNAGGAKVTVDGVDEEHVCGNYYLVDLDNEEITKNSEGDCTFNVQVEAPNGKTTKKYTVNVSRKSNEALLKSVEIEGASVEEVADLTADLASGNESYLLKLNSDQGEITFKNFAVSEGATFTVDGKTVDDNSITIPAGDVTRINVTAEDGVTLKRYLFLHEMQDGSLPYFTISAQSKEDAQQLLNDIGWYSRSEKERRNLADAWGVYKTLSTGLSLDGTNVNDVRTYRYTQASDYGKNILQLVMMGENPYEYTDQNGNCIVTYLEEHWTGPWANEIWALMGLKAAGATIPEQLVTDVIKMAANTSFDLDMRSWALGAIVDDVSRTQLASLAEAFRNTLLTEGDEAGMFYNSWYRLSNVISHGCVLEGMSAASIDVDRQFTVSDTASPLKTLKKYVMDGGFKYDLAAKQAMWAKDTIIGLGDIVAGDNIWHQYALSLDKCTSLLETAKAFYGDGSTISDEGKRTALQNAIDVAETAFTGASSVQGLGDEYYALYEAIAAVDATVVGKPQVRVCSWEESQQIDAVIETINKIRDLATLTKTDVEAARTDFDALGGEDTEMKTRLQSYVTNVSMLLRAEAYLGFAEKVDAVGTTVTIDSGAAIAAAEEAYQALDDSLKAEESVLVKYTLLQQERRIYDMISAISKLPALDEIRLTDADMIAKVENLWTSYEVMPVDLKAQITNASDLKKTYERIQQLKKAKSVEEMIDNLPEINMLVYPTDYKGVLSAYEAYNALTAEEQAFVSNADKLKAAYVAMQQQMSDEQKVQEVIAHIAALPEIVNVTIDDADQVQNARTLYEALTTQNLKNRVNNYDKLTGVENQLSKLRADNLLSQIQVLPEKKDLIGDQPDASDSRITQEVLTGIADAMRSYNSMGENEKKIFANENPEALQKLKNLDALAQQYEEYVNQVLSPLAEKIKNFELPVTEYNRGQAGELLLQYESSESAKIYLDSIVWILEDQSSLALKDKMAEMKLQAEKLDRALADAAQLDQRIESLPEQLTEENVASVEQLLKEISAAYAALDEYAQSFVNYVGRWKATETMLNHYKEQIQKAEQVEKQLDEASNIEDDQLLDEKTVLVLKKAQAEYDALTPDAQKLVNQEILQKLEKAKERVAQAKSKANESNQKVTFDGEIPWDIVLDVQQISRSEDSYTSLQDSMSQDKKASMKNAFTVSVYRIKADGSHESVDLTGGMTFTIHTEEDLTGKTVVLACQAANSVEYPVAEVKKQDVTFTVGTVKNFAWGYVTLSDTSQNGDTDDQNHGSSNKNKSGTTTKVGTTSGTTTNKSAVTSSPKTGDKVSTQVVLAAMMLLTSTSLLIWMKKKKEEYR